MVDKMNILKSYLSVSSPGVHLVPGDDGLARRLCRDCNTVAAHAKQQHPDRFGFWASLPLPDVGGALDELAYALDRLHADGITVNTNFHGYYLGHSKFEPVWEELNSRHAIVFIHPTSGCMLERGEGGEVSRSATPLSDFPNPIFEFFFDTTRAVINLFYSGAIARYPNITYIVSHAGACLPPLIERFALFGHAIPGLPVDLSVTPQFVKERLEKQFYFDLAGLPLPDQLPGLLRFADAERILYGSDYPFTNANAVETITDILEDGLHAVFPTKEASSRAFKKNAEALIMRREEAVRKR
jgi:6-methylsalicylate decarboxylase